MVELILNTQNKVKSLTMRSWKNYNAATLNTKLSEELALNTSGFENTSVQDHWNTLEFALINTIDEIAPLFSPTPKVKNSKKLAQSITNKVNQKTFEIGSHYILDNCGWEVLLKRSKNLSPSAVRHCPLSSALLPPPYTSPDIAPVRPPTWGQSYKLGSILYRCLHFRAKHYPTV